MTPAESQHESKVRLLDAALHVIRAKGYSATRIEDICEAAGLTKGSFFHHFKSKEDLALAAADHFASMADRRFAAAPYQQAADPLDRLLGYVDFRAAILQGELPDVTCLLGTMVQEVYETNPAIRSACEKHIAAHAAAVSRDIAEAKRRYAPNAPWTPESLGLFTQAVLQGAFVLAKAKGGPEIAGECLSHLRRYLVAQFGRPVDQAGRRGPKRPPKSTNAEKNKGARRRQAP
jgi:TetR/AcrR family transcriptional regulator, transcriptional repressor for nem operon